MKKITILLPNMHEGGTEKMRLVLAKQWSKIYQIEILLMTEEGSLLNLIPDNISVKILGTERYRQVLPALLKYIRKEKPDIILASMWPLSVISPLATFLCQEKSISVISEHGILSAQYQSRGICHRLLLRTSMMLGYRLADHKIGVSNGVAKDMALLSCLPFNSINVIHNPAADNNLNNIVYQNPFEHVNEPVIITVGRLKEVKNHFALIHAFSILRENFKAKLYIIGDGELKNEYLVLIKSLNLEDDVFLTGFIADPTSYYVYADLFVLSSDHEGFGNVLVEAMNVGTSIVSTDCKSGPREILCDGKYGKLVPVGDVDALAQAMFESLNEPHDADALRLRATEFSVDKIAKQYLEVFR